ncbi:MAG: peptidyl-prolyl cis-trans isomerase [Candidatus Coatesbacteria bacterium]|nr:peptidyl-prolyl cis-trans isomerase [Candidatus Coatesbacteria bacterium]
MKFYWILLLFFSLVLSSCSKDAKKASYKELKSKIGGKILAQVENNELTEGMLKLMVKNAAPERTYESLSDEEKKEFIENWINVQLLCLEARSGEIPKSAEFQFQDLLQYEGLMARLFISRQIEGTDVTDKDIEKFYNDNKEKKFTVKETIKHMQRVFVRDSTKALKTLEKIKDKDFKSLIPEDHDDINFSKSKGDAGWSDMSKTMTDYGASAGQAIWQLAKGEISKEPIKVINGYIIVKCIDLKEKGSLLSLSEVKQSLKYTLIEEARKKKIDEIMKNLNDKYKPKRNF